MELYKCRNDGGLVMDYTEPITTTTARHRDILNRLYVNFLNEPKEWRDENKDIQEEMDNLEATLATYPEDAVLRIEYHDAINHFYIKEI